MHILRLMPSYDWSLFRKKQLPENIGGAEIQSKRLIDAMQKKGVKQTVFTQFKGYQPIVNSDLNIITPKPYRFSLLKRTRWSLSCIIFALKCKRDKVKFDGIHVQSIGLLSPLIMGTLVKRILKVPLVFSVNCCIQVTYIERYFFEKFLKIFGDRIERYSFRFADAVVFSTNTVRKKIISMDRRIDANRLYTVGDIIDIGAKACGKTMQTQINQFMQRNHIPMKQKKILCVGRIVKEKGWETFLELANQLREYPFTFIICGGGSDSIRLIDEIKKLGLQDQIVFTNEIPNQEVYYAMACSSIIVIPSHYEEFGGVVLEAAIHKIPVVASKIPSFEELLADGRGVLVEAMDSLAFAKEILNLIQNKSSAEKQAMKLYQYVAINFDMEIISEKYLHIYKKYFINKN